MGRLERKYGINKIKIISANLVKRSGGGGGLRGWGGGGRDKKTPQNRNKYPLNSATPLSRLKRFIEGRNAPLQIMHAYLPVCKKKK